MTRYLHTLSAVLFYVLGSSGFLSYLLLRNDVATPSPGWWLTSVKLPLLLSGLLYGGTSVYLSLTGGAQPSRSLALVIVLPLALLFALSLVLTFGHLPA